MVKLAMICRADNAGLGTLSMEYARHLKPAKVLIVENGVNQIFPERYHNFETKKVEKSVTPELITWLLEDVDIVLSFETFYDYEIVREARRRGVKTVLLTMFEMMPERGFPLSPDLLLCPSKLDMQHFKDFSNKKILCQVPIAIDRLWWRKRDVAKVFIHSGSHAGMKDRKGTQILLDAIPMVKDPDIKFEIYSWKSKWRVPDDPRIKFHQVNFKNYWQLYREGDVLVYPQGANGICLPIIEAMSSGMAVITTDIYPFNEYMPKDLLFKPYETYRNRMGNNLVEVEDYKISPESIAEKINQIANQDISKYSLYGKKWAEDNSWDKLLPVYENIFNQAV